MHLRCTLPLKESWQEDTGEGVAEGALRSRNSHCGRESCFAVCRQQHERKQLLENGKAQSSLGLGSAHLQKGDIAQHNREQAAQEEKKPLVNITWYPRQKRRKRRSEPGSQDIAKILCTAAKKLPILSQVFGKQADMAAMPSRLSLPSATPGCLLPAAAPRVLQELFGCYP